MKKTITALTAAAAVVLGSFAPAAAEMSPKGLWNHAKSVVFNYVDGTTCAQMENHVFKQSGLAKGADLNEVKAAFANKNVKAGFKMHLQKLMPKNDAHEGPGVDKLLDAYVDFAEALAARKANSCNLLKQDYSAEINVWVKAEDDNGVKVAAEVIAERNGGNKDPKQKNPKQKNPNRDSGSALSSMFTGFSS